MNQQKGLAPILIVLLIALAVGGYLIYQKQLKPTLIPQATQSTPVSISQNGSSVSADLFIQNYYSTYLACLKDHFNKVNIEKDYSKSPDQSCPYNKNGDLISALGEQMQNRRGGDPILCAQNIPLSVNFDKVVILSEGTATVVVHTVWGDSSTRNIKVGLQKIANQWKIFSIDCNRD